MNDLTGIMVKKGNCPNMVLIQVSDLLKYCNLPRYDVI